MLLPGLVLLAACAADEPAELRRSEDAGPPGVADAGGRDAGVAWALEVEVEAGRLEGVEQDEAVAYLGVPYAAPPVGAARWQPPKPVAPWDGVRPARELSSECVQPVGVTVSDDREPGTSIGSEDCLYLNVWRPKRGGAEPSPALVFLHGGGNFLGSTREPISSATNAGARAPLYDGERLAGRFGVVVVTLNYRLGVLGFLAMAPLDAESANGTSGNYGLMDQIAALEWVQRNIERFGGDPGRVLLFGQSGGGRDVTLLATSPLTEGLFTAVAIHSAPLGAPAQGSLRERARALADEVGCGDDPTMACLRATDAGRLVTAEASAPLGLASAAFLPSIDGHVVVSTPLEVLAAGSYRGTPMLLGTNDAEYSHRWENVTAAAYPQAVAALVGANVAPAALRQYPLSRFSNAHEALVPLMSDRNVTCPYRAFARVAAAAGVSAWSYRFRQLLPQDVRLGYGAYHTSELLYLFQHLDGEAVSGTTLDLATQEVMARYWTRFAAVGDPNGDATPDWPVFRTPDEAYLSLEASPVAGTALKTEDCDFWSSLR